jgi:hypothetical protein
VAPGSYSTEERARRRKAMQAINAERARVRRSAAESAQSGDPMHSEGPVYPNPRTEEERTINALQRMGDRINANRETDRIWRRNHGLRNEPDPEGNSSDEELLHQLRDQIHTSGQSHVTHAQLQRDRRFLGSAPTH